MARKLKKADDEKVKTGLTADKLRGILDEANKEALAASEASAQAGQILRSAIEAYGLDRPALTMSRRIHKMEPSKQQATIRESIRYWKMLGFFDQIDAFDDTLASLQDVIDAARKPRLSVVE
jgi:hypothetical protein